MSKLINPFWSVAGGSVWNDISTATYNSNFISHTGSPPNVNPTGVVLKPDGLKMFTVVASTVYQWTLSVAHDITSATYDSVSLSVGNFANFGLEISPDGTKLWVVKYQGNGTIYGFDMTAWDLSTASAMSTASITPPDTSTNGTRQLRWSTDGTVVWFLNYITATVKSYTASSAFDYTTLSTVVYSFDISSEATQVAYDFIWKEDDGLKLFIIGAATGNNYRIWQYSGSSGFDLSTFSYDSDLRALNTIDSTPTALFFKQDDGTKVYFAGNSNDRIYELDL